MNKFTNREKLFSSVQPYDVKRNGFDLTHQITSAYDMGKLYPISFNEVYPNDTFKQTIQHKMILETLLKPIYSNIKIKFKQFETPYRILWDHWRNYYTGGRKGDYVTNEPKVNLNCASNVKNSLFDYLGFPLQSQLKGDLLVSAFPFVAYDFIYFWNYINPEFQENIVYNIQDKIYEDKKSAYFDEYWQTDELRMFVYLSRNFYINIDGIPMYTRMLHTIGYNNTHVIDNTKVYGVNDRYSIINCGLVYKQDNKYIEFHKIPSDFTMEDYRKIANIGFLYNVNWERDYFTSAHYNTQLGTSASIPLGEGVIIDDNSLNTLIGQPITSVKKLPLYANTIPGAGITDSVVYTNGQAATQPDKSNIIKTVNGIDTNYMKEYLKKVSVLSGSITPNDFRLMWAVNMIKEGALLSQKAFEYGNYLQFFFGRSPASRDMQQPIFRGGANSMFYTQEVTQTSQSTNDSSLGQLSGKGSSVDGQYLDDFICDEIGLTMTLMTIVPANISQSSQGVNRMWLRNDRFDYYNPAFAHIGMQEIKNCEIYAQGNEQDNKPFGYTGNYDELRYISDTVTSDMRDTLDFWHMARKYDELPALNSAYLLCRPTKRIFASQISDVPNITGIINYVKTAFRDLPEKPIPSMLDHRY